MKVCAGCPVELTSCAACGEACEEPVCGPCVKYVLGGHALHIGSSSFKWPL